MMAAFSSSFNIRFLLRPPDDSSLCFSLLCSSITELAVSISWLIRLEHSCDVTETKKNKIRYQFVNGNHPLYLQSALVMSLSLHGNSVEFSSDLFLGKLPADWPESALLCLSTEMLRGRGGTTGLPLVSIILD